MSDQLAELVRRWGGGDETALTDLTEYLYDELRLLAHAHMQREAEGDHTLGTTGLVHEAYVQLAERTAPDWRGRASFFALVSRVMRHVLVDYARRRRAMKRGGGDLRVELTDDLASPTLSFDLLAVNDALERLSARDERLARVVECRFFGGMSEEQIATALDVSTRTVERDWIRARSYLFTMLTEAEVGE
jgi:RNA polymerase sigma factor (TIGR02999 family)